MHVVYYK